MGVVYSPEEVGYGYVANPGDHAKLGRLLLNEVKSSDSIQAGIIYGSTASGTQTRRSDVDFFAIYGEDQALSVFRNIRDIKECAFGVGIYAKAEEHWESERPFIKPGQVDKQYLAHFARIIKTSPGWVVGSPLSYIKPMTTNREELLFSVRQYISAKTAKFTKAGCDLSPDYHDLQRALELPVAIARKVLLVMELYGATSVETEKKQEVIRVVETALHHPDMVHLPGIKEIIKESRVLSDFDMGYSTALAEAVSGWSPRMGNKDYQKWLNIHTREILDHAFLLSFSWQRLMDSLE